MVILVAISLFLFLVFLPRIVSVLGELTDKSADKTQEEILAEKEAEQERQDKGALANTVDFVFGEGSAENLNLLNKSKEEVTIESLNQSASEALGRKVSFDPSTVVFESGIITADKPPTFELTQEDIIAVSNFQQRAIRKAGVFVP